MAIGDPQGDPTLASDADREVICARLQEAHVHGRLTLEELSQRLDTALKARTRGELLPLIQDLPAPPGPALAPPPPGAPVIRIRVLAGLGAVKVTDRESFRSRLRDAGF